MSTPFDLDEVDRPPLKVWSRTELDRLTRDHHAKKPPRVFGREHLPFTDEERAAIIAAYVGGTAALHDLEHAYQRSHRTIRKLLVEAGVEIKRGGRKRADTAA